MKYIFTALIVLTASFAKAQIVNIPDANFKAALISKGVDANNDGEIQQAEADAVTDLQLPLSNQDTITDLTGIRSFTNLEKLDCYAQYLSTLDVSGLPKLQQVICPLTIVSLNVSNCANLGGFDLGFNNQLKIINAENCSRLKTVFLVSLFSGVGVDVNLINCDSLVSVDIGTTYVRTLNISQSDRIRSLTNVHYVWQLIARNCLSLTEITNGAGGASFNSIDVTGCVNLETLAIGEGITMNNIDLSTCPNIKNLFINAVLIVDHCLAINLKNGTQMVNCTIAASNYSGNGFPPCVNICTDDFETGNTADWLHLVDNFVPLVNVNSYCTFTPAVAYNSIKGKVRISTNNSCDSTSRAMPNVPILITDTIHNTVLKYTELTGDYNHYFYTGHYTIRPYFPYPYFSINPTTATANFDTANSMTETRNFCIAPNGVHNDLEIVFLPTWPLARPGFDAGYTLVYKNHGTTTLSGNVQLNFDNSKMNFTTASPNISNQSTGQLSWNYNNLQPFEGKTIYITFNLLPPPVNNIGDTITYLATITPSANDETAFDNSFILPQRVIGSFDPNEKQCLEGSKLDISKIGDYLHYQIHFQNEGTDTAFNIVVADTLTDKLDWNSFELISSSHPVDVKLTNNKAEFIFENIKLPYKSINEAASNGWVAFKIKPKPSVVIGDSLNNKAAIYFDFNKPVITNTATTIVSSSSVPVPVKLEYFSVNTRNNTNILNWKATCSYGNAKFSIERSDDGIHFSSIGTMSATSLRCQLPFNFMDNNPVAGKNYYRLKITDADGISFYSKTLLVGNNKAGLTITAVANNTIYLNSNKQQAIQLKIIAADGKEILNERKTIIAGGNNMSLQMKNAAKGIYTLIIYSNEGATITKRFVK
jgi:uncharacterized repeat protein (TIGR01451 family)